MGGIKLLGGTLTTTVALALCLTEPTQNSVCVYMRVEEREGQCNWIYRKATLINRSYRLIQNYPVRNLSRYLQSNFQQSIYGI